MAINFNFRNGKNPASRSAGKTKRLEEELEALKGDRLTELHSYYTQLGNEWKSGHAGKSDLSNLSNIASLGEAYAQIKYEKEIKGEPDFSEDFLKEWNDE